MLLGYFHLFHSLGFFDLLPRISARLRRLDLRDFLGCVSSLGRHDDDGEAGYHRSDQSHYEARRS